MQHARSAQPMRPSEVQLREVRPVDLPRLYAYESDPAWCAMAMVKPRSPEAFDAVWEKIFAGSAMGETDVLQRVILADGEVCGLIGCRAVGDRCEVGYGLGRAFWGRGITSRALATLLAEVPKRPLYATAAATNTASIRVLTKHGFVVEERRTVLETERHLAREEVSLVLW